MRFSILTLFPEFFRSPFAATMLQKGQERGALQFDLVDVRVFATDKHAITDEPPYGGGSGMVMKVEPVVRALESLAPVAGRPPRRILLSPRGRRFDQAAAARLAREPALALVCGRYEGIDERVANFVDEELSIGDFVLSGGEPAAIVVVDAVGRLVPGVLGCADSASEESFGDGILEYPQYTRPPEFRGLAVPPVLLSGDHGAIARWRRREALRRTSATRPDLVARAILSDEDRRLLAAIEDAEDAHHDAEGADDA